MLEEIGDDYTAHAEKSCPTNRFIEDVAGSPPIKRQKWKTYKELNESTLGQDMNKYVK